MWSNSQTKTLLQWRTKKTLQSSCLRTFMPHSPFIFSLHRHINIDLMSFSPHINPIYTLKVFCRVLGNAKRHPGIFSTAFNSKSGSRIITASPDQVRYSELNQFSCKTRVWASLCLCVDTWRGWSVNGIHTLPGKSQHSAVRQSFRKHFASCNWMQSLPCDSSPSLLPSFLPPHSPFPLY